jgi:uncharacterized protein YutE (UPF0331/DUF86 family)
MYFVNIEQIEQRILFIPYLANACELLSQRWDPQDPLCVLAQERVLHLAIETVTDVGSLIIDGFILRDASSYEDLVEILAGESVYPNTIAEPLLALVKLRKPLVQEYAGLDRTSLSPFILQLPEVLLSFGEHVRSFIKKELG